MIDPGPSIHCSFPFQNNTVAESANSLQHQSSNYQIPVDDTFTLDSSYSLRPDMLGPSSGQPLSGPSLPTSGTGVLMFDINLIIFCDSSTGHPAQNILPDTNDCFLHTSVNGDSPGRYQTDNSEMAEQLEQ